MTKKGFINTPVNCLGIIIIIVLISCILFSWICIQGEVVEKESPRAHFFNITTYKNSEKINGYYPVDIGDNITIHGFVKIKHISEMQEDDTLIYNLTAPNNPEIWTSIKKQHFKNADVVISAYNNINEREEILTKNVNISNSITPFSFNMTIKNRNYKHYKAELFYEQKRIHHKDLFGYSSDQATIKDTVENSKNQTITHFDEKYDKCFWDSIWANIISFIVGAFLTIIISYKISLHFYKKSKHDTNVYQQKYEYYHKKYIEYHEKYDDAMRKLAKNMNKRFDSLNDTILEGKTKKAQQMHQKILRE